MWHSWTCPLQFWSQCTKNARKPFLNSSIDNIQSRFEDAHVTEHLAILDLSGTNLIETMYGYAVIEALAAEINMDPNSAYSVAGVYSSCVLFRYWQKIERVFSQFALIKTSLRANIKTDNAKNFKCQVQLWPGILLMERTFILRTCFAYWLQFLN